jgi:hypothetical protein
LSEIVKLCPDWRFELGGRQRGRFAPSPQPLRWSTLPFQLAPSSPIKA